MDNPEISIVPFKFKYLSHLYAMLNSQNYVGISDITMKTLPKTGYIALMNSQPIAAGFLRRVEGGYAQLDCLTSNAYFGSQIRHVGVTQVVDALVKDAKSMRLLGLIGFTKDLGVLKRSKDLGFHIVEQTIIALKLD